MMIMEDEVCPDCKSNTSQYWTGYMAVIDPERSDIAKRMKIKKSGQYALKVR